MIVSFGRRVRDRRLAAGISQQELGRRSHMREWFIGEIERGTSNPSLESMALVADALECNLTDLLSQGDEPSSVVILADDLRRAQEALAVLSACLRRRGRPRTA